MSIDPKSLSLIVTLNKLTAIGSIQWQASDPPNSLVRATDDFIPLYFMCHYRAQQFGLFEQRYKDYSGEFEQFYWASRVVLAVVDSNGRVVWEITDHSSAMRDLWETVKRKTAGIDKLIDELLSWHGA